METLSAIVVITNNDVHSVYIVPASVASIENMASLRQTFNNFPVDIRKHVRLQRVLVSETDRQVSTIEDVRHQLEQLLSNFNY